MPILAKSIEKYTTQVFADRLKELCKAKGTYSQIARDMRINRQQFARYLNGTSMPRDALINRICEYFDVDASELFQPNARRKTVEADQFSDPLIAALSGLISNVKTETITENDFAPGIYMQYKQSFTQPDKVVCFLARAYFDDNGIMRWKRRYSVKLIADLPGIRPSHTSYGVMVKNLGALILFDVDAVAGDMVFSSFRSSSVFTMAKRIKVGVVTTHGRRENHGPIAGIHILERIPEGDSVLMRARRQGFHPLSDLPEHIQYHLQGNASLPRNVIAVR